MSKKLPLKTNENGIVGKPAEPTAAPGGSVAAAACVAGAGGRAGVSRRRRARRADGCRRRRRGRCRGRGGGVGRRGPPPPAPRSSASGSRCERCATRSAAGRAATAARRSWARPCRAARRRGVVARRSGPWPSARLARAVCWASVEALLGRAIWRLQVGGLLALGREAEEPEAGQRRRRPSTATMTRRSRVVMASSSLGGRGATAGRARAKKRVIENCGKWALPWRQSPRVAPALSPGRRAARAAAASPTTDRLTRSTPSTRRRLEIDAGDLGLARGAADELDAPGPAATARSGSVPPPSTATPGVTVARIDVSHASAGIVRATSCSACAQSKRLAARLRTVSLRFWRSAENVGVGLSRRLRLGRRRPAPATRRRRARARRSPIVRSAERVGGAHRRRGARGRRGRRTAPTPGGRLPPPPRRVARPG